MNEQKPDADFSPNPETRPEEPPRVPPPLPRKPWSVGQFILGLVLVPLVIVPVSLLLAQLGQYSILIGAILTVAFSILCARYKKWSLLVGGLVGLLLVPAVFFGLCLLALKS